MQSFNHEPHGAEASHPGALPWLTGTLPLPLLEVLSHPALRSVIWMAVGPQTKYSSFGDQERAFLQHGYQILRSSPWGSIEQMSPGKKVRVMSLPPPSFEEVALFLSLSLSTVHMLISSNPHYLRTEMTGLFVF